MCSVVAAGVALAVGCGGYRAVEQPPETSLQWPAGQPRVRLQGLIDLRGTPKGPGGKVVRWLGAPQATSAGFRRPYAVAWWGNDLLVADPDAGRVARIRAGGKVEMSRSGLLDQPIGVAACATGILVSDVAAGRVGFLDDRLENVEWLERSFERPTGVACQGDRMFVVETGRHRVWILEGNGSEHVLGARGAEQGQFNFPTSVAVHGKELWVADTLNFRVQRFDLDGHRFLEEFGRLGDAPGEMPRTKGVAIDRSGRLWITDGHLDRISFYDRDGAFLMSIGGTGIGPGEFAFPAGIAVHDDGRVAVVDSLNRRIQVFRTVDEGGA
jgi:sugar lactone lactonase YvrE